MTATKAFSYPSTPHVRRHGPYGYADYRSYRDWLRDEFSFRCVFCLRREQWGIRVGSFHLDHFVPQAIDPSLTLEYDNLLYVCSACNLTKSDAAVVDPSSIAYGDCLRVHPDGTIEALNVDGKILIEVLRLDDADYTRFRKMMLATLRALEVHEPAVFIEWMRYPEDLPDLALLLPPDGNRLPSGLAQSWFARRQSGESLGIY